LIVYRLHSGVFAADRGTGASLHGGRWNPPGVEVIYASATISLAVLEILVHYSVLPTDFVVTAIEIPETIQWRVFTDPSWTVRTPLHITQADGASWIRERLSAMTSVPSFVELSAQSQSSQVRRNSVPSVRAVQVRSSSQAGAVKQTSGLSESCHWISIQAAMPWM
jgi:RES domain-containing protein